MIIAFFVGENLICGRRTTAGELDPFEVLPVVIEKGDKVVIALEEFLYAEPIEEENIPNTDSIDFTKEKIIPNKVYAILVLDGISTPVAEKKIMHACRNHPDIEVRGTALQILAFNRYYKAQESDKTPNKEILHILINSADDTTYVRSLGEKLGKIARDGIKNWAGQDYGDLPVDNLIAGVNSDLNIEEYRELLWQENSNRIVWDKERKQFEMNY